MNPNTGDIHKLDVEDDSETALEVALKKLEKEIGTEPVPIPKGDHKRIVKMNRKARRTWAAKQRRGRRGG